MICLCGEILYDRQCWTHFERWLSQSALRLGKVVCVRVRSGKGGREREYVRVCACVCVCVCMCVYTYIYDMAYGEIRYDRRR